MAKSSNTTLPSADGEVDRLAERRVLWKVDLLLMPIMTVSYGLQFVSIHDILNIAHDAKCCVVR